jgi:uncharacterized protein
VEHITIEGRRVRIYSLAKTIADLFKYRHKVGLEVAVEALRRPPATTISRVLTMGIEELLSENRPAILRAAKAHGAGNARVFGSVARGEASANSDVDLLVDLEPGRSLLDHAALVIELEALLGRKVDIAIARGLRSRIRDRVLKEAIPL